MIDKVASELQKIVAQLPFISLAGGISRQTKILDGELTKIMPAYMYDDGNYKLLTPSSGESGIAYFENNGNELLDQVSGGRGQMYKASLRIVVWLNLTRISPADVGAMQAQTISAITGTVPDDGMVTNIKVLAKAEVPRSAEIFSKYTYREEETQFLMYPYDYFAWDLEVRYILIGGCQTVNFTTKAPSC